MRSIARLTPLFCGMALMLAAGCAGPQSGQKIDPSVIRYQVAPELKRGEALLPGGATVFFGPRSGADLLSGIGKRVRESPRQSASEILRKFQENQNLKHWTIALKLRDSVGADALPGICDDYVRYFIQLRTRAFPQRVKKLQLNAVRESGEAVGACTYRMDAGGIFSARSGERIHPVVTLSPLYPETRGSIHIGQTLVLHRFDMADPVQEFLLVVPEGMADGLNLTRLVDTVARGLFEHLATGWNLAFPVARGNGDGQGYNPLGQRRIAVRMASGDIMQLESIRVQVARSGTEGVNLTAPGTHVALEVANLALARHRQAGTVQQYIDGNFRRDSRAFLEAAGVYAAAETGIGRVTVTSTAGEHTARGRTQINLPARFVRQNGEWVYEVPQKPLMPVVTEIRDLAED